ncbi:MAG: hypothetical protein ABS35_19515 [Kaistia sp. SCN 65-12]|nr:MAG: hypothetical protein ABS35_19515 [Kaistia sp. SCN 65-12]
MATDPIRSTNLNPTSSATELLVNYSTGPARATGRMSLAAARQLIASAVAPPVSLASELSLNWPAGVEARVYGEAFSANNGVYRKNGAVGTGSWTRVGPIPDQDVADLAYKIATGLVARANLTTEDLDAVAETGLYRQALDANATLLRHYPDTRAGQLEVVAIGDQTTQTYTTWFGKRFWRSKMAANAWVDWQEQVPLTALSTALVGRDNLTTEDLDAILGAGIYRQIADANATALRHYPDTRAGTLTVMSRGDQTHQAYTTWFGRSFWRIKTGANAWVPWSEIARVADIANALIARPNLTTEDLDTVTTTGLRRQLSDANATPERHYPDGRSGNLEVVAISGFITQVFTTWHGKRYWRTKYNEFSWQGWFEIATPITAGQPYSGRTIAWIGDSIVEGNSYPTMIGTSLGATVLKFGFGSCTMAKNPGSPLGYDKMTMYRFAKAISTGDWSEVIAGAEWVRDNNADDNTAQANAMAALDWSTVDYLPIAFGTNDWTSATPLGSALTPDANGESYMGALAYVIETIQAAYPNIQIMLLGMTWRTRYFNVTPEINSDTVTDAQGKYLIDYQDALLAAGAKYNIPAFDMYRRSGINLRTYGQYLSDGVHPNSPNGVGLWVKKGQAFLLAN